MDEKKVREAIEALKLINLKKVHPFYDWEEMKEVRDTAIEALEKQLPKKTIEVNDAYTPKLGEFRVAKCPNCGHEVSDRFDVCLECRQKLDWSE